MLRNLLISSGVCFMNFFQTLSGAGFRSIGDGTRPCIGLYRSHVSGLDTLMWIRNWMTQRNWATSKKSSFLFTISDVVFASVVVIDPFVLYNFVDLFIIFQKLALFDVVESSWHLWLRKPMLHRCIFWSTNHQKKPYLLHLHFRCHWRIRMVSLSFVVNNTILSCIYLH